MPNKRFQDMQDEGVRSRQRAANLEAHPMSAREAAGILCGAHTKPHDNRFGFSVDWSVPDFGTGAVDDLLAAACRVLADPASPDALDALREATRRMK